VGAGANTKKRHLPGFKAIDGVELVSVANRSRESSQLVADEWALPTVYDNWADLIAAPDTNAICIGTWPYMHRTLVLAALEHDKHVLCEARMAMNSAEAREMLDASLEKPGLVAQLVVPPFTLNVDKAIMRLMGEGYLGDLLAIDMSIGGGFLDRGRPFVWRDDRDVSGNNVMLMGAWYESLIRQVGPASSVKSISRVNVKWRNDETGARRPVAVPDHVEIICDMASGPVLHMRVTNVLGFAADNAIWYYGTEGTLHLNASTMKLYGGRKGEDRLSEIEIRPELAGGWRVEQEFVNAIRGEETVTHTTFTDGVKYMEFTDAVLISAQSGETVHLPMS
jgi:predicted dehydrogenase